MIKFKRVGHIPSAIIGIVILVLIFYITYEVQLYKERNTHYLVCECTYYDSDNIAIIHHSTKEKECYKLTDKRRIFIHSDNLCNDHRFNHPHWQNLTGKQCEVFFCEFCMDEKAIQMYKDSTGVEQVDVYFWKDGTNSLKE